jgi:ribosomal-protein-alanine N-acetyltransferase
MEILTKRFLLRDFREEDAAAFQEYHADARSSEFYRVEEVKPGHALQLLETFNKWATEKPRRNYQFAII